MNAEWFLFVGQRSHTAPSAPLLQPYSFERFSRTTAGTLTCAVRSLACRAVHRLRSLAVLLLCALWVPATLHCDLEAAGLDELFSCAADTSTPPAAHNDTCEDACDVIEGGWVTRTSPVVAVTAPALDVILLGFVVLPSALVLAVPADALTNTIVAPPECARTWQFAFRAAPPARAPSLAS